MMTPGQKADVLHSVSVELITMFGILTNHYHRPAFAKGLPELEKMKNFSRQSFSNTIRSTKISLL
ncbi:MAG: hypothetical protein IPG22_20750 [Acidobacteria bacterium]|nr:hypothetical protein [Acidobacteriota bacterium]